MRVLILIITIFFLTTSGSQALEQAARPGPGCSGGGVEAERLYNLARDYSWGKHGMPFDREKAVNCYKEAMALGSAKAAINLGILYRMMYVMEPNEAEMLKEMNRLFQQAIEMGCPDGYLYLAYSYQKGWGVRTSDRKARELMETGVKQGSFACMAGFAQILLSEGKVEEAKVWFQRALDGGYGTAAQAYSLIYFKEEDIQKEVDVLRQGSRLGDYSSILALAQIWEDGWRQPKDLEYVECIENVAREIDTFLPPPLIDDFDKRCPPKPLVIPYTEPTE